MKTERILPQKCLRKYQALNWANEAKAEGFVYTGALVLYIGIGITVKHKTLEKHKNLQLNPRQKCCQLAKYSNWSM